MLQYDDRFKALRAAREQALPLYKEANAATTLGTEPHPDLYHRLADLRERMGKPDEALAWHRLVLADRDHDPISRSAAERLAAEDLDESAQQAQCPARPVRPGGSIDPNGNPSFDQDQGDVSPC